VAVILSNEIAAALKDRESTKAIATVDNQGVPHVVFKENIFVESDKLFLLELIDTSRTNSNLVNSIWFNKVVAITVKNKNNQSWQIKGIPRKAHICGQLYVKYYESLSEKNPEIDLGAVWEIEPVEVSIQGLNTRLAEEKDKHPYLYHLDKTVSRH
jgi:uncharacterized pyridoxamine 5'-phosphate oxidase family protein